MWGDGWKFSSMHLNDGSSHSGSAIVRRFLLDVIKLTHERHTHTHTRRLDCVNTGSHYRERCGLSGIVWVLNLLYPPDTEHERHRAAMPSLSLANVCHCVFCLAEGVQAEIGSRQI